MANVLHKTADPVDYRESVNTPDFPAADWFVNVDISAVSKVPRKYWKRPLTDPVTEMTQAEKDAVDAAEATAARDQQRAAAKSLIDSPEAEAKKDRAILEAIRINMNAIRAVLSPPLRALTMAEMLSLADSKIDDGTADTRPR